MTEFTCPICQTLYKTPLPDDTEDVLPLRVFQQIKVCLNCLPKLIDAEKEKRLAEQTDLISRAQAKL